MTLALVAGQGRLPMLLCAALDARDEPFLLCEFAGFPMETRGDREVLDFRLETLGSFVKALRGRRITRICFAGAIRRPAVDLKRIDLATVPLVPRIHAALRKGDDAALRAVIAVFEEAGIAVVGADSILPDLLPAPGTLGHVAPREEDRRDAARGAGVVAALGTADVGQACVVANGQVLAMEAVPGTAWMLASLAAARDGIPRARPAAPLAPRDPMSSTLERAVDYLAGEAAAGPLYREDLPGGGVLFKAPKPGQDRRIDLPAIGPDTVTQCIEAGMRGIVLEAGGVMVLDADAVRALADRHGLFVWIRKP